jgi:uncharacterized RDD family membrane protein YckC
VADVVTGEAVVLDVPCARFPSRLAALGIDLLIQFVVMIILIVMVGAGASGTNLDAAATAALVITVIVLSLIGYPIIWETTTRGRSPGKFALGLRVVSDDGSPERFRQALVRGLATIVDFWLVPFIGVPALICSLLSAKGKRLGDVFAGTFVIQQRLPARRGVAARPPVMPPGLAAWAASLELSGLTDQTAAMARGYLGRLPELTPGAQAELGYRIAAAVQAQTAPPPPPGIPVPAYLTAVLAERHRREHARLTTAAPVPPGAVPPGAVPPGAVPPGAVPPGAVPPGAVPPAPGAAGTPWAAPAAAPASNAPAPPSTAAAGADQAGEEEEAVPQPAQPASPPRAPTGFAPPR